MRVENTYRGISVDLAMQYLENLGGDRVSDRRVEGDGWRATVHSENQVDVGPTITLTPVRVVFDGDSDAVEAVADRFSRKAMRAGG